MSNENLHAAQRAKNDEFYTRIEDIEKEVCNYWDSLKGKTVYCNCDNPKHSNFWKYFHDHFKEIGLKELRATYKTLDGSESCLTVYNGMRDYQHKLDGDGAFQSPECYVIMQTSDIIITNPPFSQLKEFIDILVSNEKDFLIIGNKNAIGFKNFINNIKDDKVRLGYTIPNDFLYNGETTKKLNGLCRWFTTLETTEKPLLIPTLKHKYKGNEPYYKKYDNYDAINVDRVKDIPIDYFDAMGVPITFLDRYNSQEFSIIIRAGRALDGKTRIYKEGDFDNWSDLNSGAVLMTDDIPDLKYTRLLIKRKLP